MTTRRWIRRCSASPNGLRGWLRPLARLTLAGIACVGLLVPPGAEADPDTKVRVAGLVLKWVRGDKEANLRRLDPMVREAAQGGARIVVTTECFLDGYAIQDKSIPLDVYRALGEPIPEGKYFQRLAALARELKIYLVAGLTEADGDLRLNTAVLLGPDGQLLGKYRKHALEHELVRNTPGTNTPSFGTDLGRVGMMICADRKHADLVGRIVADGAEFLICPSGGRFGPKSNDDFLQQRSKENHVSIVFVHPCEFLVTGPDGNILKSVLLGNQLLVSREQIDTAADGKQVFYFDLPVGNQRPPAADSGVAPGALMKLHPTRWTIGGKPVLGTYGAERLPDLQSVREAGMNVVLAGHTHLDPNQPEGAFCRDNGIKVLHHMTQFIYHRIRLREPIAANQTTLPLFGEHGAVDEGSHLVQIDDELIRYEKMTKTELLNCQRGCAGTRPAAHREGIILFWPEACAAEVAKVKDSPNLFGYYVLDDSPGDAVSALRAMNQSIQKSDPGHRHPVCAGFGNTGSLANFAPGVCDILAIYQYPVGSRKYDRERTSLELQHILTTARRRVPGVPFLGIYQAFDGGPAQTGQGVPTPEQLREQLEDFVREGACGLIAFICHNPAVPGWADRPGLGAAVKQADREILATGGLRVRRETESMQRSRFQPTGHWRKPRALPGVVPAWYVIGPFEDTSGKMLEAAFPPDWEVDLAAVYPVKLGKAGWRVRETVNGTLGLTALWGEQLPNGVAYAVCEVISPRTQTVQLRISSDDDARVRLDGREVYRHQEPGGLEYDKDIVPITLPAGKSRLEIKVFNRRGMWGLFTRFTDLQGRPLKGLQFAPRGSEP